MPKPTRRQNSTNFGAASFQLDRESDTPLFAQLREQLRALILRRALAAGERLPPVRNLSSALGVSAITVVRAYRDLVDAGLLEARGSAGTFVKARRDGEPASRRVMRAEPDTLPLAQRLFELGRAPGVIALTSNYPLASTGIVSEFKAGLEEAIADNFSRYFHYEPPLGSPGLRQQLADYAAASGIVCDARDVIPTAGGQQGLDLTIRSIVAPGASVIVERPAYYGLLNALRMARARILEVPMQPDGMDLDVLAQHLSSERIALICINPIFQNPTGITTTEAKLKEVLAMAQRFGVPILEDDHASEWHFGDASLSLAALAGPESAVVHARSLGKTMLPGQRLGFLVVPPDLRERVLAARTSTDLHGNPIIHEACARFLARGKYAALMAQARALYATRYRRLVTLLAAGMPEGTEVRAPNGGLSIWLQLPAGADVSELYFRAVQRGVAFLSGDVFYASRPDSRGMRISYGQVAEENLEEGIARLCAVARDLVAPQAHRHVVVT